MEQFNDQTIERVGNAQPLPQNINDRKLELALELKNLSQNYWAIVDEENMSTVNQLIASMEEVKKIDISPSEAQFAPITNKDLMVNDLERVLGKTNAQKFIKYSSSEECRSREVLDSKLNHSNNNLILRSTK